MHAINTSDQPAWFVTGTDTEVGKTFVTCALLHVLRNKGIPAIGMKPVAAGCDAQGLNEDVEALCAASTQVAPREHINPYLFQAAIAPHIAAMEEGCRIDPGQIVTAFQALRATGAAVLVEGVGGFCVPLGEHIDSADLAGQLALPVILVVGMRLGCINHALLTQQAIAARGLKLVGWVANRIDPEMSRFEENLADLKTRIEAPLLGVIPAGSSPEKAAAELTLPPGKR